MSLVKCFQSAASVPCDDLHELCYTISDWRTEQLKNSPLPSSLPKTKIAVGWIHLNNDAVHAQSVDSLRSTDAASPRQVTPMHSPAVALMPDIWM